MDEQAVPSTDDGSEPDPSQTQRLRHTLGALGASAISVAGVGLIEFNHRRRLASDPEHRRLRRPLTGVPVTARSADGTLIYAEVFGPEEALTFVLGPGWTETLYMFDSMTRELVDRGFRVVAYDLRGQGRSAPSASGDWDLDRYGEDLEAILVSTCGRRRDVIVAGHSMGAMAIAAWARHHEVAARVQGAAMMNTGLSGLIAATTVIPQVLPLALAEPVAKWAFMGNSMPIPPLSTAVSRALIRYIAFGPYASEAQVAFYERMLVACPPRVRAAAGIAMCDMDLFDALARLTVPTLVLSGRLDRLTPPVQAERIAAGLPQLFRLLELAGIGHMGPLESPHELVLALLDVADATSAPAEARALEPTI